MPADTRRRLSRQLLAITDLAKRDADLAGRRLAAFMLALDGSEEHEPAQEG
jgi:hypothetical protein